MCQPYNTVTEWCLSSQQAIHLERPHPNRNILSDNFSFIHCFSINKFSSVDQTHPLSSYTGVLATVQ